MTDKMKPVIAPIPTEINYNTDEELIKPMKVEITNQPKKESYDGEDSYQYEDLNPSDEELEKDFET